MEIAVIGASRGIGRRVVERALDRGHAVRAVARSAASMDITGEGFVPVEGDATDPEVLTRAVTGADAVIVTLGVPRDLRVLKPTTFFSDVTRELLGVMQTLGVKRLLVVTGFGTGDSLAKLSFLERAAFQAFLGRAYADKDKQEEMIRQSDLDWTIARPGILNDNAASGNYQVLVAPETWRQGIISRADVAHFLVDAAETGSHIGATPALQR